jgi:hypothetical protein
MSRPRGNLGHSETAPLVLGADNGDDPVLVEGTGLFLSVRKGDRRWVTGTAVQNGLQLGVLIRVLPVGSDAPAPATGPRRTLPAKMAVPPDADLSKLARGVKKAQPAKKVAPKKQAPVRKAAAPRTRR